jgi:hypothetical protein
MEIGFGGIAERTREVRNTRPLRLPMRSFDEGQPFSLALHLLTLTKRGKYVNIYGALQSLPELSDSQLE